MKQYEFMILTRSAEQPVGEIEDDLDEHGKHGWKLVTAQHKQTDWVFYMQRRVP